MKFPSSLVVTPDELSNFQILWWVKYTGTPFTNSVTSDNCHTLSSPYTHSQFPLQCTGEWFGPQECGRFHILDVCPTCYFDESCLLLWSYEFPVWMLYPVDFSYRQNNSVYFWTVIQLFIKIFFLKKL